MKQRDGVRFITAKDLPGMYDAAVPRPVDRKAVAERLRQRIVFGEVQGQMLSPADMLQLLLGPEIGIVDGPTAPSASSYSHASITAKAWDRAVADARDFIRRNHRLPDRVFIGAGTLSLADFAATLAGQVLDSASDVKVLRGKIEFDRYFATDPRKPFNWVIHPEGFTAGPLLDLARLQGWTLKPARLARR